MTLWRRLVGDRPIVTRLVLAVALTMTAVLLIAGAFVFWRVGYALNRQLDQDLDAYQQVVQRAIATGATPPTDTPGQSYQVYDPQGRVIAGNAKARLADQDALVQAAAGTEVREDVGNLLPTTDHPYKVVVAPVDAPRGTVVVASAISKNKHDEALRELLLQLAIADLATLIAASLVGYGTARAALNPVERYRLAAENADGAPLLPVATGKDDEVTRLGHTFNALLERIRQANERERQFLADASHELRSPLALMRTELEVALLRPRGDAETTTAFESLRSQVERLITLSNALLDLEELRASGEAPHDPVDVDQLLIDVTRRFDAQANAEGRRLETLTPTGLSIGGNQHWLDLALANLVSNALRYGEGTICVTATGTHGRIRLAVSDDGPGFPAEFVDQAFDRFTRADSSRTTRGTGLGLALVQAVAEAHGGTATITGPQVALDLPTPAPSST
ncbi:ATPase domain-containing protein [Nocardioides sp. CF8]|uniref:sensor histidine kinase n=1 Tax=Nocardioides sp. CF8 TaxID=110319 RepID=UPI00032F375A|nr:HAMP domain-containing sensor histidine kinase [Nocardioides sp. CF8]EON22055.1 ATPase domain-containing protein [Nocardioides sp. CF8]